MNRKNTSFTNITSTISLRIFKLFCPDRGFTRDPSPVLFLPILSTGIYRNPTVDLRLIQCHADKHGITPASIPAQMGALE